MVELDKLSYEAEHARRLLETDAIPRALLAKLYAAYNPEVDTDAFLPVAAELFPRGNCGLASVYLRHRLGAGEITQGSYGLERHTFLTIGILAVDITADQFGGPRVYVGALKPPWSLN